MIAGFWLSADLQRDFRVVAIQSKLEAGLSGGYGREMLRWKRDSRGGFATLTSRRGNERQLSPWLTILSGPSVLARASVKIGLMNLAYNMRRQLQLLARDDRRGRRTMTTYLCPLLCLIQGNSAHLGPAEAEPLSIPLILTQFVWTLRHRPSPDDAKSNY